MSLAKNRLAELGIQLPAKDWTGKGLALVVRAGDFLYLSGHGCQTAEGPLIYEGKLGDEVTLEQGYKAARQVGINILGTLSDYLGDLDRVEQIVKVLGFVASTPDFRQQPAVMHGFSDLMTQVFGGRGQHARSAIGTNVLPNNQPVEIEVIVKIRD